MMLKLKSHRIVLKILVGLGFSFCLIMTSTLDSTRADSAVSVQYLSAPEMKDLIRAQRLDLKVFTHLQRTEFRGFKAAQEVQRKEWENTEKKERHKFFEEHGSGAERRSYIQSFIKRREDLTHQIIEDKNQKVLEQAAKLKVFRDNQEEQIRQLSAKLGAAVEAKTKSKGP